MIKIMFAKTGTQSVIPQGYQNAADFWSSAQDATLSQDAQNATLTKDATLQDEKLAKDTVKVNGNLAPVASNDEFLLKFPWPFADKSVGAVKIDYCLENISKLEDFLQLFRELYRVCANGAMVNIKLSGPASVRKLDFPFKDWFFTEKQLRFANRAFREQVTQQFWQDNPFAGLDVNFEVSDPQANLVKPANKLKREHHLTTFEQLQAWLSKHPENINYTSYHLQVVHDNSQQFVIAEAKPLEPFPIQIYPWDGRHNMWVSQALIKYHIWEALETNIFMALLKVLLQRTNLPSSTLRVANIGANIGWYTLVGALFDKLIHVDAFEPTPETVKMLQNNVVLNDLESQVKVYACALSDEIGESVLYVDPDDSGCNSLMDNDGQNFKALANKIPVETLEHIYLPQEKSQWPELILIDVEGHEQHVFDGAWSLFEQGYRPVLITEFSPMFLKLRGKCTYYRDLITKYHYQPYVINQKATQILDFLRKYNLEKLDLNYQMLSDPQINSEVAYLDVLFLPEWFDPKLILPNLKL